jgi:carbon monoxide dehydrogenase subunit G
MKVAGSATVHAPREEVWRALNDPGVLVRTIPGCQRLDTIGPDAYQMTVNAGVASIKGSYQGEVRLTDPQPPDSFTLRAKGAGAPGTVSADVVVRLVATDDNTTELSYDADAVVGGMIGGVGQRMLSGVAKKTAGEFFSAVEQALCSPQSAATTGPAAAGTVPTGSEPSTAASAPGPRSFVSPSASSPGAARGDLAIGVVIGALAALAGVAVGGRLAGRARR